MVSQWLAGIAVFVTLAAFLAERKRATETASPQKVGKTAHMAGGIFVLLALAVAGISFVQKQAWLGVWPAGGGFLLGGVFAVALGFLGSRFDPEHRAAATPIGFGLLAASTSLLLPEGDQMGFLLGSTFGLAMGAWVLSLAPTHWPAHATIACGMLAASSGLSHQSGVENAIQLPFLLAAAFVLLIVVTGAAFPAQTIQGTWLRRLVAGIGVGLIGWLVCKQYLGIQAQFFSLAVGLAAGMIFVWLNAEEDSSSLPVALCLIISLAVTTISFGFDKAFGMSLALLTSGLIALSSLNGRAILSLGPIAAFVLYRLFQMNYADTARALDLGQHYGLTGLFAGAGLVLLAMEWSAARRVGVKTLFASIVWTVAVAVIPAIVAVALGSKGYVGVLAGLGVGSAILALKGDRRGLGLALPFGFGSLFILQYPWFQAWLDLTRDEKVQKLIGFSSVLLVAVALIALLSRSEKTSEPAAAHE
jgi:hypothetical protein